MDTRKLPLSRRPSPLKAAPRFAAGLHVSAQGKGYLFRELITHGARSYLLIGRRKACHLSIHDVYMSAVHAVIRCLQDGSFQLDDCGSRNSVFVDGELLTEPITLYAGMCIELGRTLLIATDARGAIPVEATSLDSFFRNAVTLYGSNAEAGRHIGLSRESIRRRRTEDMK